MEVRRLAPGLWRWTTAHPDWKPDAGWDRDVGCVYWESEDEVVLIDPLVPGKPEERERFLTALDRDVARVERPVAILLTCPWHERSSQELAQRYGVRVLETDEALPGGVEAIDVPSEKERVLWLGPAMTVVVGDVLIGTAGGLELEPASSLDSGSHRKLRQDLEPLLGLPAEKVLPSHGHSVLSNGREALAAVLQGTAA